MVRIRVTRAARAQAGVLAGGAMVAAGCGLALGLAAGLVAGGLLLMSFCLLLTDVDGGKQ